MADNDILTIDITTGGKVVKKLGDTMVLAGIEASLPAAGTPGRTYYATDTENIFRDNGSTWDGPFGGGASDLIRYFTGGFRAVNIDGGANNADAELIYNSADKTFYHQITPIVDNQHLIVVFEISLPDSFTDFDINAFTIWGKVDDAVNAGFQVTSVIDSVGVEQTSGLPARNQSLTKTAIPVPKASLTGTFTGGTTIKVIVTGDGDTANNIYIDDTIKVEFV